MISQHVKPILTGIDLKATGLKPGPQFRKILDSHDPPVRWLTTAAAARSTRRSGDDERGGQFDRIMALTASFLFAIPI